MKVHLKSTIIDRLVERVHAAKSTGRQVEFITVYPREYMELRSDGRAWQYLSSGISFHASSVPPPDISLKDRSFLTSRGPRGDHFVVASHETFMGFDLYVIPDHCVE